MDCVTLRDECNAEYGSPWENSFKIDFHRIIDDEHLVESTLSSIRHLGTDTALSPKASVIRSHIQVVFGNLYHAWQRGTWLAYAGANSAYGLPKRYNPLGINRQLPRVLRALDELGYVRLETGWYDRLRGTGRTNRARAAEPLERWFMSLGDRAPLMEVERECIILRGDADDDSEHDIDYEDTPDIIAMRQRLTAYNELMARTSVTLDLSRCPEEPLVDYSHIRTYRVFNRGSFSIGGRFYGPWWTTLSGVETAEGKLNLRGFIRINGMETVELDYSAQHPTLLYAMKGLAVPDDPYQCGPYDRSVVKHALLIALNASSRGKAKKALDKWSREMIAATGFHDRFRVDRELLPALELKHEAIREYFYADTWSITQKMDSDIAERIMVHFTSKGIPVLMVHDSFIVQRDLGGELRSVMTDGMKDVMRSFGFDGSPIIKGG